MAPNTKISPEVAQQISNQHHETADEIQAFCRSLEGQLSGLMGQMDGDMIKKFHDVHTEWQTAMNTAHTHVREMAGHVSTTSNNLDNAGQSGAAGVGSVQISSI